MTKLLALILLTVVCIPGIARAQITLDNAFPNLQFDSITDIQAPNDGSNRIFVLEKSGRILVFDNNPVASSSSTFLNLDPIYSGSEGGLLGLAFHPNFPATPYFYLNYTIRDSQVRTKIARFTVDSENPDLADPESELILLILDQPNARHNGGQLQFGSDGYLYIGLGDGGNSTTAQDKTKLLGSMLRIDVDGGGLPAECGGESANYTVPASNPLVGKSGCDEIWAYGLRNPWRFSFGGGKLWVADVGEEAREEIDWLESGKNYGWETMEGEQCFNPPEGCVVDGLTLPVFAIAHVPENDGKASASITGGYVYEGSACSALTGRYIYGDFVTGQLDAIQFDDAGVVSNQTLIPNTGKNISTFGMGPTGALLIGAFGTNGSIFSLNCAAEQVPPAAQPDSTTINEDTSIDLDVLHNDTDANGDILQVLAVTDPAHGEATVITSSGADHIRYTPETDYNGTDTFSYTVSDPFEGTDETTVTIHIDPVNDAPDAPVLITPSDHAEVTIAGDPGGPFLVEWSTSSDAEGNPVTYTWQLSNADTFTALLLSETTGTANRFETSMGVLASWLTNQGIDLDGTASFFHRVVASDGTLETTSNAATVTFIRGRITASEATTTLPIAYALEGNYPNPFNISTRITYALPEPGPVRLTLFDAMGRKVLNLYEGAQPAGQHHLTWNAGALVSGLYFYRLEAGAFTATRATFLQK